MRAGEASEAVRAVAVEFGVGMASVTEMWSAFHEHLFDMCCSDAPLSGTFLELFAALERWESSIGVARDTAIEDARAIARQFSTGP